MQRIKAKSRECHYIFLVVVRSCTEREGGGRGHVTRDTRDTFMTSYDSLSPAAVNIHPAHDSSGQ